MSTERTSPNGGNTLLQDLPPGLRPERLKNTRRTATDKKIPPANHGDAQFSKIDLKNFRVASNDVARYINSRLLLNLVREHQPISRAELTRRSGLQRSTVSVITEQLITNNLLREGNLGESIRGRRPTFLHLNENRLGIFGISVQQSVTDIGLADLNGKFIARETFPTPDNPDNFAHQLAGIILNWMRQFPHMLFERIGLSLPGALPPLARQSRFGSNLRWNAIELKNELENATSLNVCVETIANACALSEMWFNSSLKNSRNIVVVAVSESIGVGIVINGQLVQRGSAVAGGFGHVILDENGPPCACGNRGCWETFASNSAAVRDYNKRCPPRSAVKNFRELLELANQNDKRAIEALTRMAEFLGAGIAMLAAGFAPEYISIVGDIARSWDKVAPIIKNATIKRTFRGAPINIIAGRIRPPSGLQGVIALLLQNYFAAPVNP